MNSGTNDLQIYIQYIKKFKYMICISYIKKSLKITKSKKSLKFIE